MSLQRLRKEELVINMDSEAKCASCDSILGKGVTRCWHCDKALERGIPSYQPDYQKRPPETESQRPLEVKVIDSSQELANFRKSYRKVFRK